MVAASVRDGAARADTRAAAPDEKRLFRFTALVALATAVFIVGTPLLGLRALHSADILREFYPWRSESTEARAQNTILTDVVDGLTPMHEEAKRRLARGDYPLNTGLPSGGQTLGAVPEWTVASPVDLPDILLPSWYGPGVSKLLQLLVALVFTALFLRLLGLGRVAATFGGMLYMNCGYMLVYTNWPQAGVGAMVPPVFWGVERAIQRRTVRSAVPLAIAVGASALAGFPAVTGFALLFAGAYALVRVVATREPGQRLPAWLTRARVLAVLGAGVGLGFALAAFQLVPFSHQLNDFYISYRHQDPSKVLPLRSLATLAVPDGLGSTRNGVWYATLNYAELQAFIGVTAIVVLVAALPRLRRSMLPRGVLLYLWAATFGCIALIYVGRLPLRILQTVLPSLFGMNFVGRMRGILGFLLACLAAVALEAVVDRRGSGRRRLDLVAYAGGAVAMVLGYAYLWHVASNAKQTTFLLHHSVVPAIAMCIAVAGVAGATALRGRPRLAAVALVPLALAVESVTFANGYLPRIDKRDFYPVTATHRYVLDHLGHERIAAADAVLYPGTTTYYGIRSVSAHGFHAKSWQDMLLDAGARAAPTLPLLKPDDTTGESPVLDRLGAKYWIQTPDATPPGTVIAGAPAVGLTDLRPDVPYVAAVHDMPKLRSIGVDLRRIGITPDERAYVVAEALGANGSVVGRGTRRIFLRSLYVFGVTISEPTAPVAKVRLTLVGTRQPVSVTADAQGRPSVTFVVGGDDGLREVFSEGAAIYERLHALPRIRWASRTVVQTDPATRLSMLARGLPADTVLLSSAAPPPSGATGSVTIEKDTGDGLRVKVDAQGSGYLVVADAMQHGWTAKVDGRRVPLVFADHAGVSVGVPHGTHTVTFTYVPDGWRAGIAVTLGALLLVLVIALRVPRYVLRLVRGDGGHE